VEVKVFWIVELTPGECEGFISLKIKEKMGLDSESKRATIFSLIRIVQVRQGKNFASITAIKTLIGGQARHYIRVLGQRMERAWFRIEFVQMICRIEGEIEGKSDTEIVLAHVAIPRVELSCTRRRNHLRYE
jgi:hypothetical protein